MNEISFTMDKLKSMHRPKEYLDELLAVCIPEKSDETQLTFDKDSPGYKALKEKYKNYVPKPEDIYRANLHERMLQKGQENISHNKELKTRIGVKDKINAIIPILSSISTGTEISVERQQKRLEVCSNCPLLSVINDEPACGVCGCVLKIDDKSLVNLIKYEETEEYGCKFYGKDRSRSRWKENGV